MWWLVPIAVVGAAGAIYAYFDGEARDARARWQRDRERVERTVAEHRRNIESRLHEAQSSYDFHALTDLHFSSFKVADHAHRLLRDARASLDVMSRMLVDAKTKRQELYTILQGEKDIARRRVLLEEIQLLNDLREKVFPDKDVIKAQRDHMLAEVTRLNEVTRGLKEAIRDRCGTRGRDWYEKLEQRRAARGR